ncbi:hypothetical protein KY347_03345 [Candidatus Woesearchaeota archaeon]|nr:hypothetical protein [Candidatus Woesearchaeota archaeon]
MVYSNQNMLTEFLGAICKEVSRGSSDKYALMVLKRFNKSNVKEFSFIRYINLFRGKVKISKEINSIDRKLIGKFIKKMADSIFSDLFKHLVKKNLSTELLENLRNMGVKF